MQQEHKFNPLLIAAMLLLSVNGCAATTNIFNDAKVTVRVVDEGGFPLSGVHSKIYSFSDFDAPLGLTDDNGLYSRRMVQISDQIGGTFKKEGYYKTIGSFWKWKEWGEVPSESTNFTIVMKRIVAPASMIYREVSIDFPVNHEDVYFDLAVGDWVAPHGRGKSSDISFVGKVRFENRRNLDVEVFATFNEPLSGLQRFSALSETSGILRSTLMPPQVAPTNGYERTQKLWYSSTPEARNKKHDDRPDTNYMFRTRVVTNSVGEIVSANYGWTYGGISVHTDGKTPWIGFKYYYNPDPHSRSLEPKSLADQQAKELAETMRNLDDAKKQK